ncbi:MAG TPA: hypothetical protein VH542_07305 [Steroidobacteraceae bacterium]|jgi:hypothetical protein
MLPSVQQWKFDAIAADDPDRALLLESCGTGAQLIAAITTTLPTSLRAGNVRLCRELAIDARGGYRAIVQFHVGAALFDWFFNGRSGYRAHYWSAAKDGLHFNGEIVARIRDCLLSSLPDEVIACNIRDNFELADRVLLPTAFFARSLVPSLSKLWWCVKRLACDGAIEQLAPGLAGPRLIVDRPQHWAAPSRNEHDAWLDVYGAFVTRDGLYQPKDPLGRAQKLHIVGEA